MANTASQLSITPIHPCFGAGIDTAFLQVSTLEQEPGRRRQILLDALRALAPAP